jgi:predicted RNA-binding protein with TRAM domain
VFPVGKGNTSPMSFVADSIIVIPATGEVSLYQAEYFKTGYSDVGNVRPPLTGVSTTEYWQVSRLYGADASVQLVLNSRVPGAEEKDVLSVAQYVEGGWVSQQGSVLTPGNRTTGSVVSRPVSTFGAFTFGYASFENLPPLFVNCPPDTTINNDLGSCSALLHFKAESSEYASLVYRIGSTVITSPYQFPKGVSVVEVTASGAAGAATCSFSVTVNDKEAPIIYGAHANPATLSPADHAFRQVHISYTPSDNCGTVTKTLAVTSNQSQPGVLDWEIINEHYVRLRASASGEDRVYTITITVRDESGNESVEQVTVTVPKEKADQKVKLKVKVMNNPTKTYFTLQVSSNSDKPITMQVFDIFGRVQEVRRFYADATIRLGDNYKAGVYFVKLTQGNEEVYLPLLKLPSH